MPRRTPIIPLSLGYLATAGALAVIAILVTDSTDRTSRFWCRLIWMEVLNALLWLYWGRLVLGTFSASHDQRRRTPTNIASALVITGYCILSFAALFFAALLPEITKFSRYHLAVQIALAVVAGLVIITTGVARAGADAGKEHVARHGPSPAALRDNLQMLEDRLTPHLKGREQSDPLRLLHDGVQALRESFAYSLSHAGKIATSPGYASLVDGMHSFLQRLHALDPEANVHGEIHALHQESCELRLQVRRFSDYLRSQ